MMHLPSIVSPPQRKSHIFCEAGKWVLRTFGPAMAWDMPFESVTDIQRYHKRYIRRFR